MLYFLNISGPLELTVLSGDEKQSSTDTSEKEILMEEETNPRQRNGSCFNGTSEIPGRNQNPGMTVLNKNQFIVSATVHMVDT